MQQSAWFLDGRTSTCTIYGSLVNNVCITRRQFYSTNDLAGAIIHVKDDDASPDNDDDCNDSILHAGVLEFKRDKHALDQTAKEMFKTVGDLLAKGLCHGLIVQFLYIYGLVVDYKQESAVPMKLAIDLDKSTAHFYAKSKTIDLYDGMLWLLKAL